MVVPCRGENFISAAQHVLPHYLRRYIRITRLGQITVACFANEPAFALRIEPADCLAIRNDWSEWCALSLFSARTALLLCLTATTAATLSAASALVASATPVVTVITIAVLTLLALLLSLAATTTAAALSTAQRLRIVLGLLL
jgi:hypothetical protein